MEELKGYVHSTESFGSADGPGIRFLIFLQGCKMRCRYCHNVDTWKCETGTMMTADEILNKAMRCKSYWKDKGGITVSGGEALLQIDFLLELFTKAKERGINTCLDTSGNPFTMEQPFFGKFKKLMEVCDLVLLDIKHIDDEKHKELTGCTNKNILELAKYLSDINKPVWIRHVLVPGWTDDDEYLKRTRAFIDTLSNVERVDVLPYHTLGVFKWKELGLKFSLEGVEPPSKERVENARNILGQEQIKVESICGTDDVKKC